MVLEWYGFSRSRTGTGEKAEEGSFQVKELWRGLAALPAERVTGTAAFLQPALAVSLSSAGRREAEEDGGVV